MKIVVLDGYTLNPGDLDWDGLSRLGELEVYDRTSPELRPERCRKADIILTNKVIIDRQLIQLCPELKYIGVLATGTNVVDLEAASEREIPVTNVPCYSTESVAQHTFALLLELVNGVGRHDTAVRNEDWSKGPDFSFHKHPLTELSGLQMGIIGFGSIGQAVAEIAEAFHMRVAVYSRTPKSQCEVKWLDLETLLRSSDVVSLHCPLTEATYRMINGSSLSQMKESALLINTGRGDLIDEHSLAYALQNGKIAGAGLDVLTREPPPVDHPLIGLPNCIVTPHLAWATTAARRRLMNQVVKNIEYFLEGNAIHVVNPK